MQDELKKDEELQEEIAQIEEAVDNAEHPVHDVQESVEEAVKAESHREIPKKLEEQAKQIGSPVPGKMQRLKSFILECQRVLRVTKKPDKQEYLTIVKISSIGMAIIGVVGFLVHFLKTILFQ
jgi:protein transport protein SEC61 subunit gamma-like protein